MDSAGGPLRSIASPRPDIPFIAERTTRYLAYALLLLGLVDRFFTIALYGSQYVTTDDAIIWAAAMDFGHGFFSGPYYYGQNYGPMLEALIAAPFVRMGSPLWWTMPMVSSALAILPFWSFTLWHIKHDRYVAAVCFAAVPLLLPVEFNLITTMSRGFITGIAPFALLPWTLDLRNNIVRSILTGTIVSVAWYLNPNSIIFSTAYVVWYLLKDPSWPLRSLMTTLGFVPGVLLYTGSQAWCTAHPDRIVHQLRPDQLEFHTSLLIHGLSNLAAHFQWLMPLAWPMGSLLAVLLAIVLALAVRQGNAPLAFGLVACTVMTVLSLGFGKVHEGWDSVFYPLSRMFMAMPLVMVWATSQILGARCMSRMLIAITLLICIGSVIFKGSRTGQVVRAQLAAQTDWVHADRVEVIRNDADRLARIAELHHVGLIVPCTAGIWPQFRAYLHPALQAGLPPTYFQGYERRYWQRDRFSNAVVPTILFVGGDPQRWQQFVAEHREFAEVVNNDGLDQVHLLSGNAQPTDILVQWVKEGTDHR